MMLDELHDYIQRASKTHSYKTIRNALVIRGWHPTHVDKAIHAHRKRKDSLWIQWCIIAIIITFVITVTIVTVYKKNEVEGPIYCLKQEVSRYTPHIDKVACCARISPTGCKTITETITYTNKAGNLLFSSNTLCEADDGTYVMKPDLVLQC